MLNLQKELVEKEQQYGGLITNVPRVKVSIHDPRTPEQLKVGGMTGGDRMSKHGYAKKYSEYLKPFVDSDKSLVIVEIGILTGIGLAIWCDIFTNCRIIGLDIDLGHFSSNTQNLSRLGAFKRNKPEVYEFDQFMDNTEYFRKKLNNKKIDVMIDDGFHSTESILQTIKSVIPHLNNNFVYFIEDNDKVHNEIRCMYPDFKVVNDGELTIISN
ncbi:MAG: hypothetical protein WAV11_01320 [Minisyncoccia bacterium]